MTQRKPTPALLGDPPPPEPDLALVIGAPAQAVELRYDGYDDLDEGTRTAVIDRTAEIKATKRTVETGALAIGRRLAEVKEMLPYGQFGRWCDQEFNWSQDTAWRLMRAAEVWGDISEQIPRIAESERFQQWN